jgi:hypothetical protein
MGDAHSFAQLTRFLPPELFPLFDRQSFVPKDRNVMITTLGAVPITVGVQASLRNLW